jgi:DNA-directed RNA polymerase I subunit RPA1
MQNKENLEDEELLEEFKQSKKERRFSGEESEIDKFSDVEGVEAEKEKKNQTQIGAYEEDELEDVSQSQPSEVGDMEIEDVDDGHSKGTKLDVGGKLNAFGSTLKNINFIPQIKDPEFKRAKIVMCLHLNVDSNKSKLSKILMLSLVEAILQKVLIRSVKGINKSYVVERKLRGSGISEKVVQTEGINFEECYNHPHVFDLNRLETNNIYEMMNHYGIEAARNAIVKEIRNVFDVYGIEVDYRHLSLIADFMTQNGTYKPFNRIGMQD